ncbi:hypothetical protein Lal_00013353 [Lupinus albus]|nr:hypothetical protein Lal_00013353 [Lupinus albus]
MKIPPEKIKQINLPQVLHNNHFPFPSQIIPSNKMGNMEELDKDLLNTFRKVEVNIPLLNVIKPIPRYAKFLKELCTHKRKLKGNKRINMGINVSAMIASINGIPMNVFKFISLGPLQPTGVVIQLSNRSIDNKVAWYNIFDALKHPFEDHFAPDWTPPFDLMCNVISEEEEEEEEEEE